LVVVAGEIEACLAKRVLLTNSGTVYFFLFPRCSSGERIEEKGNPQIQTGVLSPTLISISWTRGSFFGCGYAVLRK
jgi:hypothetical protein